MPDTLTRVFGIDLGTTYSCISYVDDVGKPVVVPNAESERITPSVVFFDEENVVVGSVAKQHAKLYPAAVVEMVKRSMGDPNWLFEHHGQKYRPEEISAFVLRKVVGDAEQALQEKITDVVITCPAWFGINMREATARAGQIAGLNVRCIINEPTAAAIAYGLEKGLDQTVLVYDLGGGTFDVTMIEVKGGCITVLCTGGDHELGGKDWDKDIVTYLANYYAEATGTGEDILADPMILQDLYIQAEQAKKILSNRDKTKLAITAGQRVVVELTREKFDELTRPRLERTVTLTRDMLRQAAEKGHARYEKILLVGGSTRMPQVTRRLKEEFSVDVEMYDPDEAVAKGAAIYGWKLALDEEIRTAVAEETGQKAEEIVLEEIPADVIRGAQNEVASKFGLRSAAVAAVAGTQFRNVTSKTFGIVAVTPQKELTVVNLICRNDPIPADVTRDDFCTLEANQESVEIRLMESSLESIPRSELGPCTEIGQATLELPARLPAGSPITVHFDLNDQGRLQVTALEPTSRKEIKVTVETASVMSDEEVARAKSRNLGIQVS